MDFLVLIIALIRFLRFTFDIDIDRAVLTFIISIRAIRFEDLRNGRQMSPNMKIREVETTGGPMVVCNPP